MRTLMSIVFAISLVGCAQGMNGSGDDDGTTPPVDARPGTDSSHPIDARVIDAPITSQPDAPTGGLPDAFDFGDAGGLPTTCTSSSQCNQAAGECCLAAVMVCFQDPGLPGLCL